MSRLYAQSAHASSARALCEELQSYFGDKLAALSAAHGGPDRFERIAWLRDEGRHGGGDRLVCSDGKLFNRAAINVSGVHYDDDPEKKLSSADALSTIIHPAHPHAPSVHIHISYTEMRDGTGYHRVMADLNPSIEQPAQTEKFRHVLREACPEHYQDAAVQGDRYFYIPALKRHRGATHFYLEAFRSGDYAADHNMARRVGMAAMQCYVELVAEALTHDAPADDAARKAQLAYHTAYLFQVLTLDRGTTSGLLVHDQNDLGIMGSLPAFVDRALLLSWLDKVPDLHKPLLRAIVKALPADTTSEVSDSVRLALAKVVRDHYRAYPEALTLQASGAVVPPTVANHE